MTMAMPVLGAPLSLPAVGFALVAFLSLVGSPHFLLGKAFYAFTVLHYLVL